MRIFEFNEQPLVDYRPALSANCSRAVASRVLLYRGMKPAKWRTGAFVGEIRTNRKTVDSNPIYVDLFDSFMMALNMPFRKSNTLSTSVLEEQAQGYTGRGGSGLYKVYPFDGSKYLYSKSVKDFYDVSVKIEDSWNFYFQKAENLREKFSGKPQAETLDDLIPSEELTSKTELSVIQDYIKRNVVALNTKLQMHMIDDLSQMTDCQGEVLVYGSKYVAVQL